MTASWYISALKSMSHLGHDLQNLLEVNRKDYEKLFATIDHTISCGNLPPTSLRLHFIRHDAGGLTPIGNLVETLLSYITHFCFAAERRKGLGETARNKAFMEAKKLFRTSPTTGQPGELLIYFLIEAVLQAPQVLKKMLITTNPNDERKGSDGVHIRWIADQQLLEVIFAEAKLYEDFDSALTSAFASMTDFHNSAAKNLEVNYFLNTFTLLPPDQQEVVASFVEGENKGNCQEVHACLIGHSWKEYDALKSQDKKKEFINHFQERYLAWAESELKPRLEEELNGFTHSHLRFEFFFIPFVSVDNFRQLFLDSL